MEERAKAVNFSVIKIVRQADSFKIEAEVIHPLEYRVLRGTPGHLRLQAIFTSTEEGMKAIYVNTVDSEEVSKLPLIGESMSADDTEESNFENDWNVYDTAVVAKVNDEYIAELAIPVEVGVSGFAVYIPKTNVKQEGTIII